MKVAGTVKDCPIRTFPTHDGSFAAGSRKSSLSPGYSCRLFTFFGPQFPSLHPSEMNTFTLQMSCRYINLKVHQWATLGSQKTVRFRLSKDR